MIKINFLNFQKKIGSPAEKLFFEKSQVLDRKNFQSPFRFKFYFKFIPYFIIYYNCIYLIIIVILYQLKKNLKQKHKIIYIIKKKS